ncbi:MAG: glycosyltransferase family 4 protein, partial [Stackebrandtia sp.]
QLTFGVDTRRFSPAVDGSGIRRRYGLSDRPVIVCVSRLVPRKGQDSLIAALPQVRRRVPDAALLLVGSGGHETALRRRIAASGMDSHVVITGAVPSQDLPACYAAADVFAMPCRTRRHGLDVEGLGVVYLEAAATGLPVVAGDSGGAPDTVRHNETGYVVNGENGVELADRLSSLLADRDLAARMGAAGRAWMCRDWTWQRVADRLTAFLECGDSGHR